MESTTERVPTNRSVWAWLVVVVMTGCASRYYYEPSNDIAQTPADRGLRYEFTTFSSGDGTRLAAWFLPAEGSAAGTVIHFHGKSGNMGEHLQFVDWLPVEGFNVLLFDYRGFGRSGGDPSPQGVHRDALAALAYARSRADVDPDRLVVFGQSLGGAIAITAVATGDATGVKAVVSEAALSSYRQVVQEQIGKMGRWSFLKKPVSWMVTNNRYSPDKVVAELTPIPLLLIHGTADEGIPLSHCQLLFNSAREPKTMWLVEGGEHLDTFTVHGAVYRRKLVQFLSKVLDSDD